MAMPQCCYLAKGVKRPSHTTNTIKFDRIPFDPCNSIKRFDLCPFDQKNSTYLQPPDRWSSTVVRHHQPTTTIRVSHRERVLETDEGQRTIRGNMRQFAETHFKIWQNVPRFRQSGIRQNGIRQNGIRQKGHIPLKVNSDYTRLN